MTSAAHSDASSAMEKGNAMDDKEDQHHTIPADDSDEASPTRDTPGSGVERGEKPKGPPPGAFDPRQNPDGGTKAWLCLVGGFCALFCSFGYESAFYTCILACYYKDDPADSSTLRSIGWINCVGVFQNYYQANLLSGYSPSTIGWIASLEIFFMFVFGFPIGKFFDNYGPRWLLLGGTFLEVFGLMMTSLSTEYYQLLLAQGVCSSIGASMVFYPAMSSVPTWFFRKRAFAFGIIAAGSSIGGVILPIMVQRLIPEVGFPWAMRITAFLLLFMLIIANLTITSRMTPKATPWNFPEFFTPFKEVGYDLVCFGCFVFFLGMFLPINYIILEAINEGMSPQLAQYCVPILNAASFFGRTVPGYIADKIGRYNTMAIMCSFTGIVTLALWIPASSNAATLAFAALFGFGSGAFVSLAPSLIAQISDVRKIGVRTGTLFAVISIAALISQPIGGAIVERWHGSYMGLKIYAGVLMVGGAVVLVIARINLGGRKITTKY